MSKRFKEHKLTWYNDNNLKSIDKLFTDATWWEVKQEATHRTLYLSINLSRTAIPLQVLAVSAIEPTGISHDRKKNYENSTQGFSPCVAYL